MTAATNPPNPRRWKLRILIGLAATILLIWAAPMVVALTPAPARFCATQFHSFNGTTHVSGASLGWFSPVTLLGIEFRDPDGRLVLSIPRLETDRFLLTLLWNSDDLGTIHLTNPVLAFSFAQADSNFERVLEKWLSPAARRQGSGTSESGARPKVHVHVANGTIKYEDAVRGNTWQVRALAIDAHVTGDESDVVRLVVRGVTHDGGESGVLDVEILLERLSESNPKATVKGRFTSIQLAMFNPFVRRYLPDWVLTGSLQGSGEFSAELKDGKPRAEFKGAWIINYLTFTSPTTADGLYFDRARIPCAVRLEDRKLIVEQVDLDWDYGKAHLHGVFDFADSWRDILAQSDFDLTLDLSAALLCQSIPDFYANHGFSLVTGDVKTQVKSRLTDGAVTWSGRIQFVDINGRNGKRTINWTDPVVIDFKLRDLHTETPLVETLRCSAPFLKLEASNTAEGVKVSARADLEKLSGPLGQFLDPEFVNIAGNANATLNIFRTEANQFVVTGKADARQFQLHMPTHQPWQEDTVSVRFDVRGNTQAIAAAALDCTLGHDHLGVKLAQPIANLAKPSGPFVVNIAGDLAEWQKRARNFTTRLDQWQLAGQTDLQLTVLPTAHGFEWTSGNLMAINFRATGPNVWIQEPALNVQSEGRWDGRTGHVELRQTKVKCPSLELDSAKLDVQVDAMAMRGSVQVNGDLARLRQWTQAPGVQVTAPIAGAVVGKLDLRSTTERNEADFDLTVKNFCYGRLNEPTWAEPEVRCTGRASYEPGEDSLLLDKFNVEAHAFRVHGKGKVGSLNSTRNLDLQGDIAYDLEKLEPYLQPLLGSDVKVVGKDTRTFRLAGPLFSRSTSVNGQTALQWRLGELHGESTIAWQSLKANGTEVGPGDAKVVLRGGWLQMYPIETMVHGGKVRLQPNLRLEPEPPELVLVPGRLVEKAKLTPAQCSGMLGHALPTFANSAEVEGVYSLDVDVCRLPRSAPTNGEFKGTLTIHEGRVGVNPLIRELSSILKLPPAAGIVKECKTPIHLVKGRVHHSNLELAFSDFTLKSSGSVGMDGSLSLVVEMSIPTRLATAAKLTPAQAKQTLRIPISGTIDQPRADARALNDVMAGLEKLPPSSP